MGNLIHITKIKQKINLPILCKDFFVDIFKGKDNDFSKAVCLNAAAGLIVAEKHSKFIAAYEDARKHILNGKAFEHLNKIRDVWKYIGKNN